MDDSIREEYQKIGERIRQVRLSRGMSQSVLSVKANISLPQISLIESGKVQMRLLTFKHIAEALQVSADSLLRMNIPEAKNIAIGEFEDFLADCTTQEIEAILQIGKEVKTVLHNRDSEYGD